MLQVIYFFCKRILKFFSRPHFSRQVRDSSESSKEEAETGTAHKHIFDYKARSKCKHTESTTITICTVSVQQALNNKHFFGHFVCSVRGLHHRQFYLQCGLPKQAGGQKQNDDILALKLPLSSSERLP